ncbi:MAG: prevent-host-death protein [Gammaproteobacteria bacterium]|jgi:predicted transcriptional regulator|nr:prevent-host-death protein [Gammaproteobacteria bacterium]MBT4608237.1 prevent-host-death protein [Thiotrichales bacterium]MBT3473915.1 prevent-host-death protein [Gammaproteobacteria bacterium]MBT3966067.1 prevent-host-death protein [Gammaproteobacteria bacterium]MBT4081167.1 prevent-host-death protein [Gammaproteobacteria bacterium]
MKTASIPSLRVDPELRLAAENILEEGETLSSFVVQSLRDGIQHRQMQQAFIARGMASREDARKQEEYFSSEEVLSDLDDMLSQAENE